MKSPFTIACETALGKLEFAVQEAKTERVRKADIHKLEGALGVLQRLVSEGNK